MEKTIETTFDGDDFEMAEDMTGRKLIAIRHTEGSLCMDGLEFVFADGSIFLFAAIEPVDFYTGVEEAICLHLTEESPFEEGAVLVEEAIGQIISEVVILNDTVIAERKDGSVAYRHTVTTAFILTFEDGSQLVAERFDHFYEAIDISRGRDLLAKLPIPDYLVDDAPKNLSLSFEREELTL